MIWRGKFWCNVQVQNVLQTANSLNNALLTRGGGGDQSSSGSGALSDSLYQALVTALVGSDPLVYGAVIVFDPVHATTGDSATSSTGRRAPYVFRNSTTNKLEVQSLAGLGYPWWRRRHLGHQTQLEICAAAVPLISGVVSGAGPFSFRPPNFITSENRTLMLKFTWKNVPFSDD